MAARKRSHRNRKSVGVFNQILTMLAIALLLFTAMTLFFRIGIIEVSGQRRYSAEEIQKAAGIDLGDNLLLIHRKQAEERLIHSLPYVEDSRIIRRLPNTLRIEVQECGAVLMIQQDGKSWVISAEGKILDCLDSPDEYTFSDGYALIDGCSLLSPGVGGDINLDTGFDSQQTSLLELLAALEHQNMLIHVDAIHMGDLTTVEVEYDGRFTIKLPYNADYERKLEQLQQILSEGVLQDHMTGTFDMHRSDGKTYFNPSER